jgi:hypothetical protein
MSRCGDNGGAIDCSIIRCRKGAASADGYRACISELIGYHAALTSEKACTEIGRLAHADWMGRASRMLYEDGRAGRGVERLFAGWFGSADVGRTVQKTGDMLECLI